AREFLKDTGSIFVRCDYNGNWIVRPILDEIFGRENFRNEIVVRRGAPKAAMFEQFKGVKSMGVMYDNLFWYSSVPDTRYQGFKISVEKKGGYWSNFYDMKPSGERPTMRYELFGLLPPKNYYWKWGKERALRAVENYKQYLEIAKSTGETLEEYFLRTGIGDFIKLDKGTVKYWVRIREEDFLVNNWLDIPGYSAMWGFKTENSEILLKRVIESTSNEGDLVMDFFLGSGTTTAVAHKLKRKWIGVEMGEHFYTVVLPRMKKVLAYDKSGISKEKDVKEKYNEKNASGFFKYYELEQYEDILRVVEYKDTDVSEYYEKLKDVLGDEFVFSKVDPFVFDLPWQKAVRIENGDLRIHFEELYPDKQVDIKETLANTCLRSERELLRSFLT
ncbi:MAG: DNA methyltransferase, partial [Fervidobacterium pennivorans]